jgi:DNA repair protein SbcD/Mre11
MRLLHTSDWHLGQTLHGHERGWEHQQFLDWLLDVLVEHDIDALLVSGDIFDNANPAAASQRMLYRFLTAARLRVSHLNIVLIAGNHDSPGRLEAPAPFLEGFDARVVGVVTRDITGEIDVAKLVVPLRDRAGATVAWCLAIPFLRLSDVPRLETEGDAYLEGIAALYRQVQAHAGTLRQPGQALIALGHCHMAGGQVSEQSERRIVIGGAEMLSSALFDADIAYAALGHLHLAQQVGGQQRIRYSGSPLPLSFAEIDYPHQVLKVELDGAALTRVEAIAVPRAVPLLRVPKTAAPLVEVEAELSALALPECAPEAMPYLEVRVLLDQPEPGLRARIEAALAGKPVRLARIDARVALRDSAVSVAPLSLDELGQLDPLAIFNNAYAAKYGDVPPADLLAAFNEILNQPDEVAT